MKIDVPNPLVRPAGGPPSPFRHLGDDAFGRLSERGGQAADDEADGRPPASVVMGRVRARFGIDPATAPPLASSLEAAWTSPAGAVEEDEAELLDAVADCLSVGLPLDAALASVDAGALVYDADSEDSGAGDDEPSS